MDSQKTSHANTPKTADKIKALSSLKKNIKNCNQLYELGLEFVKINNCTANELGVMLLSDLFNLNPQEVANEIYRTADSENWEVREWAASAGGNILSRHYNEVYPVVRNWVDDPSPNIRRAAALAAMYAGKELPVQYSSGLIDLIEPLLPDRDTYVKKNLGPFAIGAGLLRYYPEEIKARILSWQLSDNEQVLWNVAMIFSSSEGAKDKDFALKVLRHLFRDERKYVKGAVKSALKNLSKRHNQNFEEVFV